MVTVDDFSQCLLLNTLMTARALSRRYDRRLRPYGVTVAQFAVMGAVRRHSGETVGAIAGRIAMDRTTLTRNMDLLERKGLVSRESAARGNARPCRLTARGDALLDEVIPEWRTAQKELRKLVDGDDADAYLATLHALTAG